MNPKTQIKTYQVVQIEENTLAVSGKADNKIWSRAVELSDFVSPWDSKSIKKITFKSLWDAKSLFFCFKVEDSMLHIDSAEDRVSSINNSDRVELFFRSDANLNPYYCLEIDPTARIMDFKAYPNKKFDFGWKWPSKTIEVKSSIEKNHYIVEGSISLASLINFDLLKNGNIETGIYSAKYNSQKNGEYKPTWITWVDPKTKAPNFHNSKSFGVLKLI